MAQPDAPPIIETPITIEHIRNARWSALKAKKNGHAMTLVEVATILQLLDLAELGLAAKQEIQH